MLLLDRAMYLRGRGRGGICICVRDPFRGEGGQFFCPRFIGFA